MKYLKFKQFAHRQVIESVKAWTKRNYISSKFQTYIVDADYIDQVLQNTKSATIARYDLWANDQDNNIYEFFRKRDGGIDTRLTCPIVLNFKANDQEETILFHIISEDIGFISANGIDRASVFLTNLPFNEENKSETQDFKARS